MSQISVVVPSYNHARYIERTLRSIFAQTAGITKLLVIDDGSTDDSVSVIEKVLEDCPFESELTARENRGLCATLNEGFRQTSSPYFAYLGSDDVWLPRFLEEQSSLLESRPDAVLAFSHAFVIDERDCIIDRTDNWTDFPDGNVLPTLLGGEIFSSPSVLYRRSALEKFPWNQEAALEDYELYLKLSTMGGFARNKKALCGWRQHSSNTSSRVGLMVREQIAAQERNFDLLGYSRKELDRFQTRLKFSAAAICIRSGNNAEAVRLMRECVPGTASISERVKLLLRLLTPQPLFQWNRKRKRVRAIKKYATIEI